MQDLFDFVEKVTNIVNQNNFQYWDIRAEKIQKNGVTIENKEMEIITSKEEHGLGIRILNSEGWSFLSISNPDELSKIKERVIDLSSYRNTKKNPILLAPVPVIEDDVIFPVKKKPDIDTLIQIGSDCSKIMSARKNISKTSVNMSTSNTIKYFTSSEGAKITQTYTDTIVDLMATSHLHGLTQSINTTEGGRGGIEVISEKNDIMKIAEVVAVNASRLLDAKPAKSEKTQVVMNPDFVSLLTHEILGHPSEGDRVLEKEMAWAGGAWWAGKIGEKIGSEELNVFDDPTINGMLGWYKYDDEGVAAKKNNID